MSWGSSWGDQWGRSIPAETRFSRPFFRIVEVYLQTCEHWFGQLPCTATGSLRTACHNTLATCRVRELFSPKSQVFTFLSEDVAIPPGLNGYPCVEGRTNVETGIDQSRGLSGASSISIFMAPMVVWNYELSPYPAAQVPRRVAFWPYLKKLHRENYRKSKVVVYEGWLEPDGRCVIGRMDRQTYFLHKIKMRGGGAELVLQDPVSFGDKVLSPRPTTGRLASNIAYDATSFSIEYLGTDEELEAEYPTASFWVGIEDEIIKIETRSGLDFTVADAGRGYVPAGTTAAAHEAGETVQLCEVDEETPFDEKLLAYLQALGVDSRYIDADGFADEVDAWLSDSPVTNYLNKPIEVRERIRDLVRSGNSRCWWDPRRQKVRLKHNGPLRPTEARITLDDTQILSVPALSVDDVPEEQLTRVVIAYGVRDWSKDPRDQKKIAAAYRKRLQYIDADIESSQQLDQEISTTILAYHFDGLTDEEIESKAFRTVSRRRLPPNRIAFALEEADARNVEAGDVVSLVTWMLPDEYGVEEPTEALIVREYRDETAPNFRIYVAQTTELGGVSWGFFAPDSHPDLEDATGEELYYGFFAGLSTLNPSVFV